MGFDSYLDLCDDESACVVITKMKQTMRSNQSLKQCVQIGTCVDEPPKDDYWRIN